MWGTIVCVVVVSIVFLAAIYLKTVWATTVMAAMVVSVVFLVSNFFEKREKKLKKEKKLVPGSGYRGEALRLSDDLMSKFKRLTHLISLNQAKINNKVYASEEDMRAAFRKAVKELDAALGSCTSGHCSEPQDLVLKRLIKKYEKNLTSPTP